MYFEHLTFPIIAPKETLDFYDIQTTSLNDAITPYQAYLLMTNNPPIWLKTAFYLRDIISKFGNVQPINGFIDKNSEKIPAIGEKVDFFDVVEINDQQLILQATDRHLSVMMAFIKTTNTNPTNSNSINTNTINTRTTDSAQATLTLVGSVKTHNLFGKLYMLPVAPAHKLIVKSMFKKLD